MSNGSPRKIRICVCGGRDYEDINKVWQTLDLFYKINENIIIIAGGAKGADSYASSWAIARFVELEEYPANWDRDKKAAGPIRNRLMLSKGIDILLAFPGGRGTADMIKICQTAGVKVKIVK